MFEHRSGIAKVLMQQQPAAAATDFLVLILVLS